MYSHEPAYVHMYIHHMSASQNQGTSLPVDVWFPVISQSASIPEDLIVLEEGAGELDGSVRSTNSSPQIGGYCH